MTDHMISYVEQIHLLSVVSTVGFGVATDPSLAVSSTVGSGVSTNPALAVPTTVFPPCVADPAVLFLLSYARFFDCVD